MKIRKINGVEKFREIISGCKGEVELVTEDGDRLNLKSKLFQYVDLKKLFWDEAAPEMELLLYDSGDVGRLVDFLAEDHHE